MAPLVDGMCQSAAQHNLPERLRAFATAHPSSGVLAACLAILGAILVDQHEIACPQLHQQTGGHMAELIISVSGLRGVIGAHLTPELAARFAAAYVAGQPEGPLVLARDGRTTGPMLVHAIRAALMGTGRNVLDADIAATPTVGVLVRDHQAAGGIQVTASHNPLEYNGIKLFSPQGSVLDAQAGEKVLQRFEQGGIDWVDYQRVGAVQPLEDTVSRHLELVLATVDVERIRSRGFRVLLDSNRASGSVMGRVLLSQLGCQVTILGDTPDGHFEHRPEPTAENLGGVRDHVVKAGAVVGFCQDPDADRLAIIDETGRYIGEEYTVALCVQRMLAEQTGPIVTNCSTSRMSEDLAARAGVPLVRAPVGEANVVAVMRANNAVFGGEGNGGPIDPRVGFIRDSFVGMAQVLDMMAARKQPVSQLADELPQYAIHKTKQELVRDRIPAALDALEAHWSEAVADRMDGLRLDWPDRRWLLVRASNTEPIVRIIAEATDADDANSLCQEAAAVMAQR